MDLMCLGASGQWLSGSVGRENCATNVFRISSQARATTVTELACLQL